MHEIEDLLDGWDEWRETGRPVSFEEFVSRSCPDAAAELVAELRRRIAAVDLMDRLLDDPPDLDLPLTDAWPPDAEVGLALRPGSEPVSGYVLHERLGRGGHGEVWRARGPGDFRVALKFVPLDRPAAQSELRALDIMRQLRHPHLLATFGAWQRDGFLITAMELADGTLQHRFREAAQAGPPGIPRPELLRHMQQAAQGIDYLNRQGSVQHRDIKPQNLMLVGGCVKVGDFGIARIVGGRETGHTGRMSVAFAPPEFFEGRTAATSDQYSLAITYCYLRSGRLPFRGTDMQILRGHLRGRADLSMLPACERPVLRRALARIPGQRWPDCVTFIAALARAASDGTGVRRSRRKAVLIAGLGGAVAVAGLAAGSAFFPAPLPAERSPLAGADEPLAPHGDSRVPSDGSVTEQTATASWEVPMVGRTTHGEPFRDQGPEGGLLTGVDLTTGQFGAGFRFTAIASIRPVYTTPEGTVVGSLHGVEHSEPDRIRARDGYAIGGFRIAASTRILALQVVFQRIRGPGLDPEDTYTSAWFGAGPPQEYQSLGESGHPIVGLTGVWTKELRALGLIHR